MRQLRKSAFWTVAAILLWLLASAADRRTAVEIYSDGGRIHLEVAGTSLSAPIAMTSLTAIEIQAADSIDPPGGYRITVSADDREVISERLPHPFRLPRSRPRPPRRLGARRRRRCRHGVAEENRYRRPVHGTGDISREIPK